MTCRVSDSPNVVLALREPLDLTGVAESLAIWVRGHSSSLPIANDRFSAQGWKN